MRFIFALLITTVLLMGAVSAVGDETPPALRLRNESITETPVTANYSWEYPDGEAGEWTGVEACGMAPTDPAVLHSLTPVYLMDDETYTVEWNGVAPDELIVFSWDIAVFADQDHTDDYQYNPEIVIRKDGGKFTLKPDRVYDFQARWLQSESGNTAYGLADYYLVTEELIMLDGPGSVMLGGWSVSADPAITEDLRMVFEKGTVSLDGAVPVPIAYLGSQVVAGKNHAFLCLSKTAYPGTDAEPAYTLVYLYEDLQGNVTMLNMADFDIGSFCTYGAE